MKFVAKAQESQERNANMMMRGFVKIQTAKVLCLRLQCLERIRADVLKFTTGPEGQVNRMNDDLISRKIIKAQVEAIRDCWAISLYVSVDDMKLYSEVINVVLQAISDCPTAFDKEKVIEEIKNQFKLAETCASEPVTPLVEIFYVGQAIGYEESIKIVEKGGIE